MNKHTKKRIRKLNEVYGQDVFAEMLRSVIIQGKEAFYTYANNIGRLLAEAILLMEREEISGPDYRPNSPEIQKWASQPGSVFIGDRKVKVQQPRLRGPNGEIKLQTYQSLKGRGAFSEELLQKALSGLSGRRYPGCCLGYSRGFWSFTKQCIKAHCRSDSQTIKGVFGT